MPNWKWKTFPELTLDELYRLLALRQEVYDEDGIPHVDMYR